MNAADKIRAQPPVPAWPDEVGEALRTVIPNVELGRFTLTREHLARMPVAAGERLREFLGGSLVVFAIPIDDAGLWLWHYDGRQRRLFANLVLAEAAAAAVQRLRARGDDAHRLCELVGQKISLSEAGVHAGLGTRGWNNLLLHPRYGAWMQIDALVVRTAAGASPAAPMPDVCLFCAKCLAACPARALERAAFHAAACARLVAAPWMPRSRARAVSASSYFECCECLTACPVGTAPAALHFSP